MKDHINVKPSFLAIMDHCYQFAAKLDDEKFEQVFCDEGEADKMRQAMFDYFHTYMANQKNNRTKRFDKVKGKGSPKSFLYLARIGVELYGQLQRDEEHYKREVGEERYKFMIEEYRQFTNKVKELEGIVEGKK